jgi:hypothetical protein
MKGVSGDVNGPPVDNPDENAAPPCTLGADRREPFFDTRLKHLSLERELRPLPETTAKGHSDSGTGPHLQKISAFDLHLQSFKPSRQKLDSNKLLSVLA